MRIRYDYKCRECGCVEERRHFISEDPEYLCPKCGGEMYRLVSPNIGGFVLKGGGWPDKMRRRGDIKYDPPMA